MAYRFRRQESVTRGIRRIAQEQIGAAMREAASHTRDSHDTVHQIRKHFKKIRALLRLARFDLGEFYRQENRWYRDAANRLSTVRDAESAVEAFKRMQSAFRKKSERETYKSVLARLVERRDVLADESSDLGGQLEQISSQLEEAYDRIESWQFSRKGFAVVQTGLIDEYRKGRSTMQQAYAGADDELFHEWRKHVKNHWYHTRLLNSIWPRVMKARCTELRGLAELLGDDHDLAVLRSAVESEPGVTANSKSRRHVFQAIDNRHGELCCHARFLGQRLFAEKPNALRCRMHSYWKAWKNQSRTGCS